MERSLEMRELTWFQAFFRCPTLKQLREDNDLDIPEWYNNSVYKLAIVTASWCMCSGIGIGYIIWG